MLKHRLPDSYSTQEGVALGNISGQPTYIDSSDASNIYLGYCKLTKDLAKPAEILVCRVTTNGNSTIRYYAYGSWDNRATLAYQ